MSNARSTAVRQKIESRLKARRRAEIRFQMMGLGAILLAVAFLFTLLGSIGMQAVTAFSAHTLELEVEVDPALADPRGDGSEESLRRGSYNRILQIALQEEFPAVSSRSELRELFGLFSAINAAGLLDAAIENPGLLGSTLSFKMPISDDADLYLKGATAQERREPASAPVTADAAAGAVTLTGEGAIFAEVLERYRAAREAERDIIRVDLQDALARAAALVDTDAAEIAEADAERARTRLEMLSAGLDPEAPLRPTVREPSLIVLTAGGAVLVEEIAADGASASGRAVVGLNEAGVPAEATLWTIETPPTARRITDRQIIWTRALEERGMVDQQFNTWLFTNADSREPELAGVLGAVIGSVLTMIVTMLLAVPIGVGAAIYLEEFAPKNRWTELIEVNINNLAAVPSIVFGLLGLAVFINFGGMPRSAPLVGGMVLALMTLPTVIIASRASLRAVPPSIREAALGVGASKSQAVFHHVLPLAAPGILTGSIIGLAQALGETAPLLMIGMVAFIADPPTLGLAGFTEPATVMPVQVFLWSTGAERAFEARTAAAIVVLLTLMILFNAAAIWLRRRFERRW